jgi:hypothetical protein
LSTREAINESPLTGFGKQNDTGRLLNDTAGEPPDPGDGALDRVPDGFAAAADDATPCSFPSSAAARPARRLLIVIRFPRQPV